MISNTSQNLTILFISIIYSGSVAAIEERLKNIWVRLVFSWVFIKWKRLLATVMNKKENTFKIKILHVLRFHSP